jgi:hypothetical protein
VIGRVVFYRVSMRCAFHVDGDPAAGWAEEREDLPLYRGDTIIRDRRGYEIVDGPHYDADWESATISAGILVKPVPTTY